MPPAKQTASQLLYSHHMQSISVDGGPRRRRIKDEQILGIPVQLYCCKEKITPINGKEFQGYVSYGKVPNVSTYCAVHVYHFKIRTYFVLRNWPLGFLAALPVNETGPSLQVWQNHNLYRCNILSIPTVGFKAVIIGTFVYLLVFAQHELTLAFYILLISILHELTCLFHHLLRMSEPSRAK